jgi:hypothetical protein
MAEPYLTAYSHKLASTFTRQISNLTPLPRSSFQLTNLPYDIRVLVYKYIDTDPPFSPRTNTLALYLSCQSIRNDLDDIEIDKLNRICARIESKAGIELNAQCDPDQPRCLTIVLPYNAFDNTEQSFQRPKWRRELLASLHPLFALHLETLHIKLSSKHCPDSSIPLNNTLRARLNHEDVMQNLIQDICAMIDYVNPGLNEAYFKGILGGGQMEEIGSYPTAKVRAKRICLSWDLRPSPGDAIHVSGRIIKVWTPTRRVTRWQDLRRKSLRRKSSINKAPLDPFPWAKYPLVMKYHLRGADLQVGEIGIISPSRWVLDELIKRLVANHDLCEISIISSAGVGREIMTGLVGVEKKDFFDEEESIQKERDAMHEESERQRELRLGIAYAQEGITID